ncbi:Predicted arabinose efflux permease, MFS family [Actinacidiphila yanglinensis]|uniref:Predicted arabinose efflux permease, MFS family n=1 Tax=Actinacidiphila yanglinensis TaxID=310779 RepID=A0A1H6ECC8_9ACTN|nr:MFS transporter [Actinacidiphila yanglinensis]SEG95402.1 Predicted arabinose efflux permease, MFS family [Actinacidiphila yanglinensis]
MTTSLLEHQPHPRTLPVGDRTRPAVARRRHGAGFWMVAFAFLVGMAFSTVPTPLYPLYEARDGFSTFTVTVVYATFAVGVVISLMLAGHISDWVGRKKILLPSLGLELAGALVYLSGASLPLLLAGRLVTGLGVGMLTATATAHLQELHTAHRPGASGQRFELVSTVANIGGLGVGPLVGGILAQFVGAPLRVPFLVFAVLLGLGMVAVALTPETVAEQMVKPAYRPQRVSADHGDRAGFLVAAASGFAAFAVFGMFTSIAAGFVGGTLHHPSRALAGLIVFVVFGAAAVAQTLTGRLSTAAKRRAGLLTQAVGLVVLLAGMRDANLPAFLAGGILSGIGAGVLFKAALGAVAAAAVPAKRSEALADLFLISYVGLSLPALGIGLATREVSTTTAMTWFTAVLLVMLGAVAALGRRADAGGPAVR